MTKIFGRGYATARRALTIARGRFCRVVRFRFGAFALWFGCGSECSGAFVKLDGREPGLAAAQFSFAWTERAALFDQLLAPLVARLVKRGTHFDLLHPEIQGGPLPVQRGH
jgi:hypothetical protein